ncbi:hypothetical protein MASR2M117_15170 [Paludibacter sp.]
MTNLNFFSKILLVVALFSVLSTNANTVEVKVSTLNAEWLSCVENGPTNEILQINNIAQTIILTQPDIIALQEVGTSSEFATIDTLVKKLGSEWEGKILATNNDNCGQNQAVIYKKSKVKFINAQILNSGINSQGNTYRYNWSSGRFPVVYNVSIVAGQDLLPLAIVNIHAKAFNDNDSYTRRKGGSEALKVILDSQNYNTQNIVIIGDFNDYLIDSQCGSCGDSPYKNFMDDSENYRALTTGLKNPFFSGSPVIDNIIISNELFDKYVQSSSVVETGVISKISDYKNTTTDHLPISATFKFNTKGDETNCKNFDFSETFSTSLGDFTPVNISGYQNWYWKDKYGAYISGFANGINNDNEDWLISPTLDLSNMKSATLKFEHALNYSPNETDKISNHTLWISNNYKNDGNTSTAQWTQINIPVMPAGNNWTYVNSGEISVPAAFLSKDINFAFRYLSNSAVAGTWEIKNLSLNAICNATSTKYLKQSYRKVFYSNGHINIGDENFSSIKIYNLLGTCIFEKNLDVNSTLPFQQSGIYIIKIDDEIYKIIIP